MELIDQHTKGIMEGCKERARDAGLVFQDESLEYIVTNRDLLELSPKLMIPTLYDYWVHDVEVLRERGKYELYPSNPYETVINTRPPISFYNDNNPDWLNVMIFYHVLAHIDFFQNNLFFENTWQYDFAGQALSDKRVIARLRSEKGRWVDYVIEFARGIDNLVGYYGEMAGPAPAPSGGPERLDFYFDVFLQDVKQVKTAEYVKELERLNDCAREHGPDGEKVFFEETARTFPEFEAVYEGHRTARKKRSTDLLEHLMEHAPFLARDENRWMKTVLQIARNTSLFFQPQIRTKILNEGWASYWHEALFLRDDRIRGHEVSFARVHAGVASLPRVGVNPYALGLCLFQSIERMGDRGRLSQAFRRLRDVHLRKHYDTGAGEGRRLIFALRAVLSDFLFVNQFVDQEFVDEHRLFVAGKRLNPQKGVWEHYVKSRRAQDYRAMLLANLYHPPHITVDPQKSSDGCLYLSHRFEGRPLVRQYIANTLLGVEVLWGGAVKLETSEAAPASAPSPPSPSPFPVPQSGGELEERAWSWERVVYTMEKRKLSRAAL